MYILSIDTSNQSLGVAIMKNDIVIGEVITNIAKNHSVRLMPAIDELMKEVNITPEQLEKIVVAKGPGSYTGVRIGLTTAKTLAWALNIPVVGVSSLEALAYQGRFSQALVCPFFDARRGLVFTGVYQWKEGKLSLVREETNMLMEDLLQSFLEQNQEVLFLSPDIDKHAENIKGKLGDLAIIPENTFQIANPSHLALASTNYEADHTHSLTPNYLRLAEAEANWLKSQKETK
ncbi:tRNA (adenosine(37)-N6)-threonylcarbamoyltransferase complex dimerization subunit type 1 TsaB [Ornithinibacillus sp. L9]|uniref:tRNA (Adenosine(37)-N6)-threonylcarbamoyltransferase complex dimerization subunit type 1 TsaB n=1 Tax=Ornithinibacillus caprae TaxID=2678566 RepID=A0A6N8FH35_9BACI|nr:tRNA (adenosine(37)-N6)-threonylcarbamoyltransferase complex dimerization subunit type 1 TsaB [Ornithinibacillus caprae]MUK88531.1 tRNA (adenosine(37)-N6)-threonylcarbamoyltransferase complex dimerization subunit type 1 TsaB [Ornithinibacillus caprae]